MGKKRDGREMLVVMGMTILGVIEELDRGDGFGVLVKDLRGFSRRAGWGSSGVDLALSWLEKEGKVKWDREVGIVERIRK